MSSLLQTIAVIPYKCSRQWMHIRSDRATPNLASECQTQYVRYLSQISYPMDASKILCQYRLCSEFVHGLLHLVGQHGNAPPPHIPAEDHGTRLSAPRTPGTVMNTAPHWQAVSLTHRMGCVHTVCVVHSGESHNACIEYSPGNNRCPSRGDYARIEQQRTHRMPRQGR